MLKTAKGELETARKDISSVKSELELAKSGLSLQSLSLTQRRAFFQASKAEGILRLNGLQVHSLAAMGCSNKFKKIIIFQSLLSIFFLRRIISSKAFSISGLSSLRWLLPFSIFACACRISVLMALYRQNSSHGSSLGRCLGICHSVSFPFLQHGAASPDLAYYLFPYFPRLCCTSASMDRHSHYGRLRMIFYDEQRLLSGE